MYFTDRDWTPFLIFVGIAIFCIAILYGAVCASIEEDKKPAYSIPKDEWVCSDHSINPIYMSDAKGGITVIPQTVCVQYTKIK